MSTSDDFHAHMSLIHPTAPKPDLDIIAGFRKGHPAHYADVGLRPTKTKTLRLLPAMCEPGCIVAFSKTHRRAVRAVAQQFLDECKKVSGYEPYFQFDATYMGILDQDQLRLFTCSSFKRPSVAQAFVLFILERVEGFKPSDIFIVNCRDESFKRHDNGDADSDPETDDDEPEAGAGAEAPTKKRRRGSE